MVDLQGNSRLLRAKVLHERHRQGERHRFDYEVFYAWIDLDELSDLSQRCWSFSEGTRSIYSLGARDFLDFGHEKLRDNCMACLKQHGLKLKVKKIFVLAHLRTLGFNFNPISLFVIEAEEGNYALVEVDNTFGDAKIFPLGFLDAKGQIKVAKAKDYYVSPFIEHDAHFLFTVNLSKERLYLGVETIKDQESILTASMHGRFEAFNDAALLKYLVRLPMVPLKVFGAIHWHALKLWLKRVPFFRKQDFPERQKDYYVHKDARRHVR